MTRPPDLARLRLHAIYKFVPHHGAEDFLRIGWMPTRALEGTIHGLWSVLMAWPCKCPMRVPVGE